MKKVNYLFLLLTFAIFSCEDDIDNLTDINVSTVLNQSFNVAIAEDDPLTESISETLDVGDNNALNDLLSQVEEYNINSITATISNYQGANDIVLENAMVTFEVDGGSNVTASLTNLVISDIEGTPQTLPFNADALNAIGETLLSSGGTVTIDASSTVSGAPVSFTIDIDIDVEVTVDTI